MIRFSGSIFGAAAAAERLNQMDARVWAGAADGARVGLAAGETIVKGYQSGRPGPNVITGTFRRNTKWVLTAARVGEIEGEIGNSSPQAARLEHPFYGPDSLGRMFPGNTYPSFTPAVPEVERVVVATIEDGVERAVNA